MEKSSLWQLLSLAVAVMLGVPAIPDSILNQNVMYMIEIAAAAIVLLCIVGLIWRRKRMSEDQNKGYGSIFTIGTMTGGQVAHTINNFEDNSTKRQIRDLFNTVDPRLNQLVGSHDVRMEPHSYEALMKLCSNGDSPVLVGGIVSRIEDSLINNGSLGITYAASVQLKVRVQINEKLAQAV